MQRVKFTSKRIEIWIVSRLPFFFGKIMQHFSVKLSISGIIYNSSNFSYSFCIPFNFLPRATKSKNIQEIMLQFYRITKEPWWWFKFWIFEFLTKSAENQQKIICKWNSRWSVIDFFFFLKKCNVRVFSKYFYGKHKLLSVHFLPIILNNIQLNNNLHVIKK